MTNDDLNGILKSAQMPTRPPEYWDEFPRRVMRQCQLDNEHRPQAGKWRQFFQLEPWEDLLAAQIMRRTAAVTVCVALVGLGLVFVSRWMPQSPTGVDRHQFTEAKTYFREIEALFPNQLRSIVFDERGSQLVLSDKANLPQSAAVYVKICGAIGCRRFVTFSGQRITYGGKEFEVLSSAKGEVLVVGDQSVWSSAGPRARRSPFRIEARQIQTAS